jgi:CheY-like chemotaxis protein
MARIAWIEDDHERINSLVRLLERDGHSIETYSSWEEVQENLAAIRSCAAIILDIILPPIKDDPYQGLAVLELLKENGFTTPVVVCSRVQNPVVLERMRELGVKEILRKPIRPTALYDAVNRLLSQD